MPSVSPSRHMDRSEPDGSPLARKRTSTRRKFATEVYKPSNRKLAPNRRLWPCENLDDISEDTSSSKSIRQPLKPKVTLDKVKSECKEESSLKNKQGLKPTRKMQSKQEKLADKSNAQKKVSVTGRVTRSSAMTNNLIGRSKMEVLDEEETTKDTHTKETETEEDADAENFLDVSADHRIHPVVRTSKPTQQSMGADVTFTFDVDKHAHALADCSPIPRAGKLAAQPSGSNGLCTLEPTLLPPARPLKTSNRMVTANKLSAAPSPPKKRARREAAGRSSKVKASNGALSDDPMMI